MSDPSAAGPQTDPTDALPGPPEAHLRQVLLGVRLVGFGPIEEVARRVGLGADAVGELLNWGEREALVAFRSGRISGWSLTAEGRARGEKLLAEEVVSAGAGEAIRASYENFLELNGAFLGLCTSWQVKTTGVGRFVPNHHDDPEYDAAVIIRLGETHGNVVPILDRLATALDRFAHYRPRLARALELVQTGDLDWFTRPVVDSYHTVWFELHEDLLATLGLERSSERS